MGTDNGFIKIKCEECPKVLFFIDVKDGRISKDCPRCGHRNVVVVIKSVIQNPKMIKKG